LCDRECYGLTVRRLLPLLVAACSSSANTPPQHAEPVANRSELPMLAMTTKRCSDAAHGIEGATRGVRDPEEPVFEALQKRCETDDWSEGAISCFAKMREGDLGTCGKQLDERSRESLFGVIAGSEPSLAGIAVARARLEQLSVGVPACDEFVTAVNAVLSCEAMPIDTRVQLGNETAQFWSLPTNRLRADDLKRISDVCGQSRIELAQQAAGVGCAP
jgi:hypothetical protein